MFSKIVLRLEGGDIWEKNMNKVDVVGHSIREDNMNKGSHVDSVSDYDTRDNNEGSDYDDNDYLVDEDNMVENVDIDVLNFYLNIDKDVGWLGVATKEWTKKTMKKQKLKFWITKFCCLIFIR